MAALWAAVYFKVCVLPVLAVQMMLFGNHRAKNRLFLRTRLIGKRLYSEFCRNLSCSPRRIPDNFFCQRRETVEILSNTFGFCTELTHFLWETPENRVEARNGYIQFFCKTIKHTICWNY